MAPWSGYKSRMSPRCKILVQFLHSVSKFSSCIPCRITSTTLTMQVEEDVIVSTSLVIWSFEQI
jgi:hypothetical protein